MENDISLTVFTVCSGRTDYLVEQLKALKQDSGTIEQHVFVKNGFDFENEEVECLLRELNSEVIFIKEILPIGAVIEKVKEVFKSSHILKLDDDAIPVSKDFIKLIKIVAQLKPNSSFSPFPVGLLKSMGGMPIKKGEEWSVLYSGEVDKFFTTRPVKHIGGFCRVTPQYVYKEIVLDKETHSEDKEFSVYCRDNDIEMFYLENGIVVEHAESPLGQSKRNKEYNEKIRKRKKRKDIKL